MSYDPCPECKGPTEKFGQPCSRCCARLDDISDIVDSILQHGSVKADSKSPITAADMAAMKKALKE